MDVPLSAGSPNARASRRLVQGLATEESPAQVSVRYNPNTKADAYSSSFGPCDNLLPAAPRRHGGLQSSPDSHPYFTSHDGSAEEATTMQPPVILVDALKQGKDAHHREVAVDISHEQSPIKVIRHSQHAAYSELSNSGSTGQAAQVRVDLLPNVSLVSDEAPRSAAPGKSGPEPKQQKAASTDRRRPLVVKESARALGGQPMRKQPTMQQTTRSTRDSGLASRIVPKQNHQLAVAGEDSDIGLVGAAKVGDDRAATPDSNEQNSDFKISSRSKANDLVGDRTDDSTQAITKKGPKVVASKYMLEATAARRRLGTPSLSKTKTFDLTRPEAGGRSGHSVARGASTPNQDLSRLPVDSFNASAILPANVTSVKQDTFDSRGSGKVDVGPPTKHKITQQCLDVLHSRYLQWIFVEHRAKKSFKDQESSAMSQLYSLWEIIRQQHTQLSELDAECEHLRHITNVDELLGLQGQALDNVTAELPRLSKQYGRMAAALDCTRYQLPVRGILVPDGNEAALTAYHDSLLVAAHESEQLLGELAAQTRRDGAAVRLTQLADVSRELARQADDETKELNGCRELVAAVQSLTTKEASLRMQQMELAREPTTRFG